MKIAICDDRENDRAALRALLEAYGQEFEIREYGSGDGLCGDMEFIRECGIIFLDINWVQGEGEQVPLKRRSGTDAAGVHGRHPAGDTAGGAGGGVRLCGRERAAQGG